MKRQPTDQDKIFANEATDELKFQIYSSGNSISLKKKKKPNQKLGKSPKSTFLPNVCVEHLLHTDGQQAHEKMFHIANYWRMQITTTMK